MSLLVAASLRTLDLTLFQAINGSAGHSRLLDVVMVAVAQYSPELFAAVLVALWLSWRRERQLEGFLAGASALIALGIGQVIALTLPRERPFQVLHVHLLIHHSTDGSFPSDHATLSFAIASMIMAFDRKLGVVTMVFALWVAAARVYVGAHYPTDVVGGAILGAAVSHVVFRVSRTGAVANALDRMFVLLGRVRLAAADRAPQPSAGD